jgi:hypothetical protein
MHGRIALPFRHAFAHQLAPLVAAASHVQPASPNEDPARQSRRHYLGRRAARHPGVASSARMHRGRGDDVAAVPAHIDALRQSGTIAYESAGVGKIKVPAAAAGRRLHGYGKRR